jgi:hypothetical protein
MERDLISPSAATLAELLDLMGEQLVLHERIDHGVSFANFVLRNRGAGRAG